MKISGRIAKVIREPALSSTGWCIFLVDRDHGASSARQPLLKVVGNFSQAQRGARVVMDGDFVHHATFGSQFKARYIREAAPRSQNDLASHLVEIVPGLTPAEATRIVSVLGSAQTIQTLDSEDRHGLAGAVRIDAGMADKIVQHWAARRHSDELGAICHAMGLSRDQSSAVFRDFKAKGQLHNASKIIRENPFRLAGVIGNQFAMLERMARDTGARLTTPERVDSALEYALELAARGGHCFLGEAYFLDHALRLCNSNVEPSSCVSADMVVQRLDRLVATGTLTRETRGGATCIALGWMTQAERQIAEDLVRLSRGRASAMPNPTVARSTIGFEPTEQQRAALDMVLAEKVSLLTGNPGTGKTTITRQLIKGFAEGTRVSLLAPTGQAADRLSDAAGRPASTIHMALGLTGRPDDTPRQLDADLVIVDEMSMVDVRLASQLMRAIPDRARVVFAGDPEQIPSIGAGAVLRDLMDSWLPCTHLTEIVRQKADSGILTVSALVRQGQYPFTGAKSVDALHLPAKDDADCARKLVASVAQLRRNGLSAADIQVLVPWRHGQCGTTNLNQQLRPFLNDHPESQNASRLRIRNSDVRLGDRVRHTRNDYENGLLNGMVGTVKALDETNASITVSFRGTDYAFEPSRAQSLQLDYATTIHRSQGSQYPATLLGISSAHEKMLDRRLVYTAITRAERLLITVAEPDALSRAVHKSPHDSRQSRLSDYLADAAAAQETHPMEATHGQ